MADATLQAIADRLEIEEVLSKYAWAIDTKDFDGLDEVFTPDAFIDYESAGGIKGSYPEIKAWLSSVLPHFPTYQHLVTNKHVTIDGDTAVSRAGFYNPMGQNKDGGISFFYVGGEYHDKLVRTDAGWRITERIENTVWTDGDVPAPPS